MTRLTLHALGGPAAEERMRPGYQGRICKPKRGVSVPHRCTLIVRHLARRQPALELLLLELRGRRELDVQLHVSGCKGRLLQPDGMRTSFRYLINVQERLVCIRLEEGDPVKRARDTLRWPRVIDVDRHESQTAAGSC